MTKAMRKKDMLAEAEATSLREGVVQCRSAIRRAEIKTENKMIRSSEVRWRRSQGAGHGGTI